MTIKIDKEKCKGCELCIVECPKKTIKISVEFNKQGLRFACFDDNGLCNSCKFCALVCPEIAIEVYKE